jgi:glycosyltransferase involved in cell wall biosynthesis
MVEWTFVTAQVANFPDDSPGAIAVVTRRILHIIPSLQRGGTAKQLALLAAGLSRDEFEVHVVALNCGGALATDLRQIGIEPVIIGRRWRIDPMAFWRLRRHLRHVQPDLVHTWLFDANTYGRMAALTTGVQRLVASERGIDVWKMDHELALDRRLARFTDRVVINSAAVERFYVHAGLPPQRITVIPSGVPPSQPSPVSRAELLDELGLPQDAKLIAYLGPLTVNKRLKELIWAADQLRAVNTPAHLLIIGDGPLRSALERYRRLNRIEDRVHFLGARDDVARILPHVGVLWQAGCCEGQSSAILEAMAAGVPVVAANTPGNRELVIEGETGYLVPMNQRAGFARCTLSVIENPELAQRLGAAGRRRALEFFRVEEMVAHYARLYRELLDG